MCILFDLNIAITTKDQKETFFTSFLMRDKAFDTIKSTLGGNDKSNSLLKRAFIREDAVFEAEGEEEEEEQDEEYSYEEPKNRAFSQVHKIEEFKMYHGDELQDAPIPQFGDPLQQQQDNLQVLLDVRDKEINARLSAILQRNTEEIKKINDDLDPKDHQDYVEILNLKIDNMTLPVFFNRIYGKCSYGESE